MPTTDDNSATTISAEPKTDIPPPGPWQRFSAALIVLAILLTPAVGFVWLRVMSTRAIEAAALSHARDMVIVHFARTHGEWPTSWEDLADDFEPADSGYQTENLEALQEFVDIDFDFDVTTLEADTAPEPVPRVVWLKNQPESDIVAAANAHLIGALRKRMHGT